MAHRIEFVDYENGWLTYMADGKQVDVNGEFYRDSNGTYHHTHIFEDDTELELTW